MSSPAPLRFFVVHMQKTAGTSLRDRFRHHYDEAAIYPNRTDGRSKGLSVISLSHLEERWAERGDEVRVVAGHFPLSTTSVLGAPFVTLTVLRPVVERTLSYLRHQRRVGPPADREKTLEEIYDDPFRFQGLIENHMTRMLSLTVEEMRPGDGGLSTVAFDEERLAMAKEAVGSLDLLGLQPHFEELCDALAARYGLRLGEPVRSNTTEPEDAPAALVERIVADNALDLALYEHAEALYAERGGPLAPTAVAPWAPPD
ncbi:MAG TPA: hypothetical protein P5254_13635 [Aquihabitans sp.]|nr:hypothetical protein [Aquihabitans sp.]